MKNKKMVCLYMADIAHLPDPEQEPDLLKELPPERRQKIERQLQPEKRKQSLGAGLLLKDVLSRHGISQDALRFGEYGKPEVDGIYFNLSHSGELIVCAVSEKPVGCDVEELRKEPEGVAEHFFCENEKQHLRNCERDKRDEEFFRLWTMKESYMKMTGEGMYLPLNAFELLLENEAKVLRNREVQPCVFKEFEVPGYKVTVCAEDTAFADIIQVHI